MSERLWFEPHNHGDGTPTHQHFTENEYPTHSHAGLKLIPYPQFIAEKSYPLLKEVEPPTRQPFTQCPDCGARNPALGDIDCQNPYHSLRVT